MKLFNSIGITALLALMLGLASCSKDASTLNENAAAPVIDNEDLVLEDGEVLAKQPKPGIYTITKFIDTGDDETAQFNGYTFEFEADGTLTATTNTGAIFTGSWALNGAETVMTLVISGNDALDDLDDDDWNVIRITNQRIRINAAGPDKVVFQIQ